METVLLLLLTSVLWPSTGLASPVDSKVKMQKAKLQFKIRNYFLATLFSFILLPSAAFAAELYFGTHAQEIGLNQYVEVGVFLNTEGESINAFEGSVSFPSSLLAPKEIWNGNSIVSLWIEEPFLEREGVIRFSGVIPGGYEGSKGYLFSVIFQAQEEGKAVLDVRNARTLLNDGEGSESSLRTSPLELTIGSELKGPEVLFPYDPDAPESFVPQIAQDQNLFDGKWFLVFATQDKASGVHHYEVREVRQDIFAFFQKWRIVRSPYLLQDQELKSAVFVKAVDKKGNERVAVLSPRHPLKWYENYGLLIIIVGIGVLVFLYTSWIKRKFLKRY